MLNKLSTKKIDSVITRDKLYRISDGGCLYLAIRPVGTKSWEFRYKRPSTGKYTYTGLGKYPDISLTVARERAAEHRRLLAEGVDPMLYFKERKHSKEVNIFASVAALWIDSRRGELGVKTADRNWRTLELYVFPALGNLSVSDLNAPYVIGTLRHLEKADKLDLIQRIVSLINQVMTFSTNYGLVDNNPLKDIGKVFKKPTVKNNPSLELGELSEFMFSLSSANLYIATKGAIEFQLHTMTRPGEAARAKWDEVNFKKKLWVIPPDKMKKRREHIVPLTKQALALLEVMRPLSGHHEYIFSSPHKPGQHISLGTANNAITNMGFKDRTTAHGLRSLASTTLHEKGFDSHLIEVALSHIDKNAVRNAYNHAKYLKSRRKIMKWWSKRIVKAGPNSLSAIGMRIYIDHYR